MDTTTNRKLPRGPQADRPRADEVVRKRGGADLQNGWLGRHGTLSLCDDRMVFVPTILDTIMLAKRREIPLDAITAVERVPKHPEGILAGGRRPRVLIHTAEVAYEFMFGDIDAWIDAMQIVYKHRQQHGRPHAPTFIREGSTTELLMEL